MCTARVINCKTYKNNMWTFQMTRKWFIITHSCLAAMCTPVIVCLTGLIEVCIWDRFTPELESFCVYRTIKSSRSSVFPLSRDFPLLVTSTVTLSPFLCLLMEREIESTWFIPRKWCWAVEVCRDCHVFDHTLLKHSGNGQDKKIYECFSHYNVLFITLHATTESPVPL